MFTAFPKSFTAPSQLTSLNRGIIICPKYLCIQLIADIFPRRRYAFNLAFCKSSFASFSRKLHLRSALEQYM